MAMPTQSGKRKGAGRRRKKKTCPFCKEKTREVDYTADSLARYLTERGKIVSRRTSGCCAKHQRRLAVALRRAREMALVPYVGVEREA